MKKWLFGVAVLPLLTGLALAKDPVQLTDGQMDKVTAGFTFAEMDVTNVATVFVGVNAGTAVCPTCVVSIGGPSSPIFTLLATFAH
jgi:hypothetical protein